MACLLCSLMQSWKDFDASPLHLALFLSAFNLLRTENDLAQNTQNIAILEIKSLKISEFVTMQRRFNIVNYSVLL